MQKQNNLADFGESGKSKGSTFGPLREIKRLKKLGPWGYAVGLYLCDFLGCVVYCDAEKSRKRKKQEKSKDVAGKPIVCEGWFKTNSKMGGWKTAKKESFFAGTGEDKSQKNHVIDNKHAQITGNWRASLITNMGFTGEKSWRH